MSDARGILLVVSAPSGTGKTTICREFLKAFPKVRFSVSFTTRPRRPGETDGKDYFFVSEEDFKRRLEAGEFIEWVENYGHLYGTSRQVLETALAAGEDILLDIEPRGAKAIRALYPEGVFVFILPPSLAALRERLAGRGEDKAQMERRLRNSLAEIRESLWYDYLLFNDKLDDAVGKFKAIYLAQTCRREREAGKVASFFGTDFS